MLTNALLTSQKVRVDLIYAGALWLFIAVATHK